MKFGFQEIAFSAPYFLFLLPPPALWPPRRHIYSVRKVERRRHWRLIFFICTEHFLQLFWTSSKHLNLFFRIWLMLENIVSRCKFWSDLVNLNLFANSIRKHAPPPPPCAYMHAQFCDWRAWLNFLSSLKAFSGRLCCVCMGRHTERGGCFCDSV